MKKFQVFFAALMAILTMSFTVASHQKAFKNSKVFAASAGTWTTIQVGGTSYTSFPAAVSTLSVQAYTVTNVTSTTSSIDHTTDCPSGSYNTFCGYDVVTNGAGFKVAHVYYKHV